MPHQLLLLFFNASPCNELRKKIVYPMKKENLERLEHSTIDNIRLFYSFYFIVDGDDLELVPYEPPT